MYSYSPNYTGTSWIWQGVQPADVLAYFAGLNRQWPPYLDLNGNVDYPARNRMVEEYIRDFLKGDSTGYEPYSGDRSNAVTATGQQVSVPVSTPTVVVADISIATVQSACLQKLMAVIPAPMGCDWVVLASRNFGNTTVRARLDSDFGNTCSDVVSVDGDTNTFARDLFLQQLNENSDEIAGSAYTAIVLNITGTVANRKIQKSEADSLIYKSLLDLNRFPKIPYDSIISGRPDCAGVQAQRLAKGTSTAIVTDEMFVDQGNYPKVMIPVKPVENQIIPVVKAEYESDFGYVGNVNSAHPSIPEPGEGPGGTKSDYPVPNLGGNFEHDATPGGNILSPSTLGSASLDIAQFVNAGLTPGDFGEYSTWDQIKAAYAKRTEDSRETVIPSTVTAWVSKLKEYQSVGLSPSDVLDSAVTWDDVKKNFFKQTSNSNTAIDSTDPQTDMSANATQNKTAWWTVGGIIVLVVGLAYLGRGQ